MIVYDFRIIGIFERVRGQSIPIGRVIFRKVWRRQKKRVFSVETHDEFAKKSRARGFGALFGIMGRCGERAERGAKVNEWEKFLGLSKSTRVVQGGKEREKER